MTQEAISSIGAYNIPWRRVKTLATPLATTSIYLNIEKFKSPHFLTRRLSNCLLMLFSFITIFAYRFRSLAELDHNPVIFYFFIL